MNLLARILLLLDGQFAAFANRIDQVTWQLETGGGALMMVGIGLGGLLAILAYLRPKEALTPPVAATLLTLRISVFILLSVVAAGTVCQIRMAGTEAPAALVVVDDSPSMNLKHGDRDRFATTSAVLDKDHPFRQSLDARYSIQVRYSSDALALPPERPQNLAKALLNAVANDNRDIEQVFLLSDGVQNDWARLSDASQQIHCPVHTIGFGNGDGIRDARVHNVHSPRFAFHRDRVSVTADLRGVGLQGQEITARLFRRSSDGEEILSTTTVTIGEDEAPAPGRLEFTADHDGLQTFVLRVDPVAGEITKRNNELAFVIDVRQSQIRVLFIEGNPSWEYRFVKNAFDADPAVAFHGLVRLPPDEWFYQGPKLRDNNKPVIARPRDGIPTATEELAYFDVIILGDVERKLFERSGAFDSLDGFVRERGGGLATIGGMSVYGAGNFEDTALAHLLPIHVEKEKKKHLINRFNVRLTSQGLMHPVTRLESNPVRNAEIWSKMPWVEGGNALRRVKAGATTLLEHPTLRTRYGARPVAAAWHCGNGRTYATALDGTWHWALANKQESNYHHRYWGLLARWLAGDPRTFRGESLLLNTRAPEVNKTLSCTLNIKDESGTPVTDADITFRVIQPNGHVLESAIASSKTQPGRYAFGFTPAAAGTHRIEVDGQNPDGQAIAHTLTVDVLPARDEWLRLRPAGDALAALAQATGGTANHIDQLAALQWPSSQVHSKAWRHVITLWQCPGLIALLVILACAEWFLRKRKGLA